MILCDMDGVLATGAGRDTECGEPIYRTFLDPPEELEFIRAAGVPLHVVTAKLEAEAAQVLKAIGLEGHIESVIGANRLFWPSVRAAVTKGQRPRALVKSVYRDLLPTDNAARIVMLEDRRQHLWEMFDAGAIDFGILVPGISFSENRVVRWFDLNLALRLARGLATGELDATDLCQLDVSIHLWRRGRAERLELGQHLELLEGERYLLVLPSRSPGGSSSAVPTLEGLNTHFVLRPVGPSLVGTVRALRRVFRKIVARVSEAS